MATVAFPGHGRFKFNSGSNHLPLPRSDPAFHELWATDKSCSCTLLSSFTGTSATAPTPVPPSFPATTITSTLLTTPPSSTSQSFSIPTGTNTFMTTSLDSQSSLDPTTSSSNPSPTFVNGRLSLAGNTVCLGHGLDASVDGLLATMALSGLIGLLLWLLFALLRPRFRQIYGLREWFVQERLRPQPLRSSFWAFLNPPVPMIPSISGVPSDPHEPGAADARKFPSDEELSQRTLWFCFLIVLGWSILGLAGALPLYIISMPCLADTAPTPRFLGGYSTLLDLSLMRVLQLFDNREISTPNNAIVLEVINGHDLEWRARLRVIILTALLIVVGLIPALVKILREYGKLLAFRRKWTDVHMQGKEMGWISAREAPGFVGWGEKRLKDFILRTGLSSSLDFSAEPASSGTGRRRRSGRPWHSTPYMYSEEDVGLEVDILSLFTIVDTQRLALLIEERDIILEQLEIAETKYITSFRITTPDPSLVELNAPAGDTDGIAYISRPKVLGGANARRQAGRRRRRGRNPADGSSSLSPTSYVAPSSYYKLGIRGINGGRFADGDSRTSFTDSVNQRIAGTRLQEGSRLSLALNRLPIGSLFRTTASGPLDAVPEPDLEPEPDANIPDPRTHGPNYVARATEDTTDHETLYSPGSGPTHLATSHSDDDWVDVGRVAPIDFRYSRTPSAPSVPSVPSPMAMPHVLPPPPPDAPIQPARASSVFRFGRRPKIFGPAPSEHRSTFPLRDRAGADPGEGSGPGEVVPPHLRVQRAPPFVRPLTGLNHDELGAVYAEIRTWRSRLKTINEDIRLAQENGYQDIADGTRVKGWLLIGRGLRFLPDIQLIEGRAKEDVRWDILQQGGSDPLSQVSFWTVVVVIAITLLVGLIAAAGLAVATSPDYAHYLPLFRSMANRNDFLTGLITVLAPSVGATLFFLLAVLALHLSARLVGTISISAGQRVIIKAMFYVIVCVAVIGLVAAGALLYAFGALSRGTRVSKTVADGSIYIAILALAIIINVAIASPALLMLQPLHLRRVLRAEKSARTPRQRFRATYPRTYNPLFAMACCILAVTFASTFAVIFPLLGPPVVLLVFLTLVAHRFLVGYVYGRTRSQTGGLLQIWLLKRFASLIALQPILLGLILLSRKLWPEGGALVGAGIFTIAFVEVYTRLKERSPGRRALNPVSQHALESFGKAAKPNHPAVLDEESPSIVSSGRATRTRGSFASVLEMMSLTLAVAPSHYQQHGPVPISTETLDDLTATERAARSHPDAPPRLPPLPFAGHAEEMSRILFAPELIAPPPIVWLPNDSAGVARAEAQDLEHYHGLKVVIDVRSRDDVNPRRRHRPTS
ncbi:hypothetical protein EDB92DRAFT_1857796 [Lactarius akahatsu]|uniref:CSC1/OSCA1-like 7TM region domain-containing protein n=1 Tax=Lactarius akahatsu TaxID=416441 RepID=A0AAD4QE09_9AGAM|nr:hypothetical protein EDB92DRAFT_1857796 [Lactarius akahatsu]